MQRIRQKNPPNFEHENSPKVAGKIRQSVNKFRQVIVETNLYGIERKIAHHTPLVKSCPSVSKNDQMI